jgi:aspartyl-tRNA(Asn)/glutamyl-tRNA(Gln) amidotransferase subunit A
MDLPHSISQLHSDLLTKKYSVVELVDAYLARINTFDKDLNSLITVTEDEAYAAAKNADKLIIDLGKDAIRQFPLLGVVVAYKDNYLTKGIRTTAGAKVLDNYIPAYSATSVERISKAGAVTIGKANMDAWAHGSSGENSDFGETKNPWNKEYVPGGSSSGSAVSVASSFSLFSTGSDTCGSIRLPSNYCGVVGFKPTYGSVSRYGVVAMASSLDSIGHITNCAEDAEKIFAVTKGTDDYDSTMISASKTKQKNKLRIGLPKEFYEHKLTSEIASSISNARKELENMGHEIIKISLPHTKYAISVYYIVQPAEVSSNLGRYDGVRYGNKRIAFSDEGKRRIMLGTYVLSSGYYDAYYLKAMKVRSLIIKEVEKAFEKVDIILAPVAPTPPFKLGEKVEDPLSMYLTDIYAATANLTGIPSLALPSGFSKAGLPLGFQIMSPQLSEARLFKLGKDYQKVTDWHTKKPSLV